VIFRRELWRRVEYWMCLLWPL